MWLTILKKYWREILIAVLVLAVALSVKTCNVKAEEAAINRNLADSAFSEVRVYKLKDGTNVAQIKTLEVTSKSLLAETINLMVDKKKLEEQIGNTNRLVTYYQGKIQMDEFLNSKGIDTVFTEITAKKDTIRTAGKAFAWSNKWLTLQEYYYPGVDSLKRRYRYDVEFNIISYRKGKTLFKPGQLVTDVTFADPAIKVKEFKGLVVTEPPKTFLEKVLGSRVGAVVVGFLAGRLSKK